MEELLLQQKNIKNLMERNKQNLGDPLDVHIELPFVLLSMGKANINKKYF